MAFIHLTFRLNNQVDQKPCLPFHLPLLLLDCDLDRSVNCYITPMADFQKIKIARSNRLNRSQRCFIDNQKTAQRHITLLTVPKLWTPYVRMRTVLERLSVGGAVQYCHSILDNFLDNFVGQSACDYHIAYPDRLPGNT